MNILCINDIFLLGLDFKILNILFSNVLEINLKFHKFSADFFQILYKFFLKMLIHNYYASISSLSLNAPFWYIIQYRWRYL